MDSQVFTDFAKYDTIQGIMKRIILFLFLFPLICYANDMERFWEIASDCQTGPLSEQDFPEWEKCMRQIPMYDEDKRQWYFDAYKKSDDEKIYECFEFCQENWDNENNEMNVVCTPDNSVKIIEQLQNEMTFYMGDLYGSEKPVLFHKSISGRYNWSFGRLEQDHGYIAIHKDDNTAQFAIEGVVFQCKLAE